jgi:putative lipoic acid-binding regulatory protein
MILNENGKDKADSRSEQQIVFPVTYVLKVIIDVNSAGDQPDIPIRELLHNQNINFRWVGEKKSGKNNFLSYSIEITLLDKSVMDRLYVGLKTIKSVKLAI